MSSKNDDISARSNLGRYDLPGGSYEIMETDVTGSTGSTAIGRRVVTTYRPAYLGEDETVLACCHHAHEVAKAHGAREVMLEHLVHALVRVPESAQVLSDRGINVESLKRESASVISSEIPVDHTTMVAQLRASKDFNTVMHLAAAAASRRDERSLGVRDLLEALLRFDPKSRVVRMIRRHAIEGEIDEPIDPLAEVKAIIERYAGEQRDLRLAVNELRNAQAGQTSSAVAGLEDRLRGLERSINLLVSDGGGERSAFGDRLKGFHDALSAHRNDTRVMADRLQNMERLIGAGGGAGGGQLPALIGDRLLSVQKTMENHRLDFARLEQSLSDRMRALEQDGASGAPNAAIMGRLEKLETTLDARIGDNSRLESILNERLKAFELVATGAKSITLPAGLDTVSDRVQNLERQIGAQRAELQGWQGAIEKDLKAIEEMFDLIPADGNGKATLADDQVLALQQSIDTHRAETQKVAASVQERHSAFERMLDGKLALLSGPNGLSERLAGVERSMAAQRTDQANVKGTLDNELEQIRKAMLALGNAQQTLSGAIDEWRQNNSGDLSVISNRLAMLERSPNPVAPERTAATQPSSGQIPGNGAPSPAPTPTAQSPVSSVTSGLLDRVDRVLAGRYNAN